MYQIINKADYVIDWHYDTACLYLKENEINFRVKIKDGDSYLLTQDLKLDRANLEINEGIVTDVSYG